MWSTCSRGAPPEQAILSAAGRWRVGGGGRVGGDGGRAGQRGGQRLGQVGGGGGWAVGGGWGRAGGGCRVGGCAGVPQVLGLLCRGRHTARRAGVAAAAAAAAGRACAPPGAGHSLRTCFSLGTTSSCSVALTTAISTSCGGRREGRLSGLVRWCSGGRHPGPPAAPARPLRGAAADQGAGAVIVSPPRAGPGRGRGSAGTGQPMAGNGGGGGARRAAAAAGAGPRGGA
jgi:collagen type III alpha